MARRVRKLEMLLALGSFAGTLGITMTAMLAARHQEPGHPPAHPASSIDAPAGSTGYLSPAALDRQWLNYSDSSTCADRASGDGVSAVRLSPTQIAWFFSDSSLGPSGKKLGFSRESGFVHNLVVMQTLHGRRSTLVTITGGNACAGPGQPGDARSVVSAANAGGASNQRYWSGDGLQVGGRVLRFYTSFLPGRVPFVPVGTVIADYSARQLSREGRGPGFGAVIRPRITTVPTYIPPGGGTPIVWGAAVLRQGGTAYIYGWQSSDPNSSARQCYLARVAASRLTDTSAWQFYAGNGQWAAVQSGARPIAAGPALSIDTGFSVIRAAGQYWLIERSGGFGSPDIEAYPGPAPWGPFDPAAAILLYHAPDIGLTAADRYQIMYEARAEPALSTGSRLVISYNVNSLAVTAGCISIAQFTNTVIQPRFISVPRAVFAAGGGSRVAAAQADPSAYPPAAVRRDPTWFESWKFPGGCPPVLAVRDLSARRSNGSVQVRWRDSGLGVLYRVYLRSPGGSGFYLVRTTSAASITLSRLIRGGQYEVMVIPANKDNREGPAASITITAP